jgi:hypothetical protein
MSSLAIRFSLVVAAGLSGALAGCLGGDGENDEPGQRQPRSPPRVFRELAERPLDLPRVDLHRRSIRRYGVAGRCFEELEVGAIALPAIPGEAALGPWPDEAALSRGPVYAALVEGAPRIVFLSGSRTIGNSRAIRTIWVSRPSYSGPVLVRGGRLDRPGELGFGSRVAPDRELRLPAGSWRRLSGRPPADMPAGWRAAAVPTRIPGPGCYAFQVDGQGFAYVLAFGAQLR